MGSFMEEAEARKKQKVIREAEAVERKRLSREAFESSGASRQVKAKSQEKPKPSPGSMRGAAKKNLLAEEGIKSPWRK